MIEYTAPRMTDTLPADVNEMVDELASLRHIDAITARILENRAVPKYPNCLKACIRGLGYTIQEIAEETGISRRTLSSYCSGRVPIPQRALRTIAEVLGCSPDVLVPLRAQLRLGLVGEGLSRMTIHE